MLLDKIAQSLNRLNEEETLAGIREALAKGFSAKEILLEGLSKGMELVGERYARKEYFVPDMLKASRIFNDALPEIEPLIKKEPAKPFAKGVIGLVKGNTQDNGKNIIRIMFEANGIEVRDLGRSVPCEKFVEAAKEEIDFIGLSIMTVSGVGEAKRVIKALEENGLRKKVKVIVGGAAVNAEKAIKLIGADAYASDATQAVLIMKQWFQPQKSN
ncbi:MAG: cobalamin-dependent protein [Nitrospirae bacterium]|nr:cobalamin-dependent protein [Nitrospirota bacterium]MCL5421792.1 cobalamin-dependent protein [Nitrospirota bacterium]